jgi:hypothetical protein
MSLAAHSVDIQSLGWPDQSLAVNRLPVRCGNGGREREPAEADSKQCAAQCSV